MPFQPAVVAARRPALRRLIVYLRGKRGVRALGYVYTENVAMSKHILLDVIPEVINCLLALLAP